MKSFPHVKNPLILAPMAEVTSLPFRLLCRKYGAAMAYTEQISSIAIIHQNQKTLQMTQTSPEDHPVGLQLFGRSQELLVQAAEKAGKEFDVIDLNLGCPSKKIVAEGYGSALLKEKEKVKEIITYMVTSLDKPVTVKMRSGFKSVEALELVRVIEKAGAAAITLHARTQEQGYSGKADWDLIRQVRQQSSIPIIGNGDVREPQQAVKLLEEGRCDFLMIGRAARDNPWIFRQILHYKETGEILAQTPEERLNLLQEYITCGETSAKLIKNRAIDFTKGIPNMARIREQLGRASSLKEIQETLKAGRP